MYSVRYRAELINTSFDYFLVRGILDWAGVGNMSSSLKSDRSKAKNMEDSAV